MVTPDDRHSLLSALHAPTATHRGLAATVSATFLCFVDSFAPSLSLQFSPWAAFWTPGGWTASAHSAETVGVDVSVQLWVVSEPLVGKALNGTGRCCGAGGNGAQDFRSLCGVCSAPSELPHFGSVTCGLWAGVAMPYWQCPRLASPGGWLS